MVALHADDLGQVGDDAQVIQFHEAAHYRADVARVADGHEHGLARQIIVQILGDLVGIGLLAQDYARRSCC